MSALYLMQYQGAAGVGGGAIYIGKGKVVGVDVGGSKYDGTYAEANGRIKGTATMTAGTGALVTGAQVQPGTKIPLSIDWPSNFANGQAQPISVMGQQVHVKLEKVGDIP